MTKRPSYDAASIERLVDRTEYESWMLEAVYALVEQELFPIWPDAVIYPIDRSKSQFIVIGRANIILGDWRPGFLNAGAPLVFVSTFKLLDMLIEWILEENGIKPTFRFQQKKDNLANSPEFPPLVEVRSWLKERLVGLYCALEPLRGTIIHDKHFTAKDGAVSVSSSKGGTVGAAVNISADELRKLAVVVVSTLRFVGGSWKFDGARERILRYELDELQRLHGQPVLGQKSPFHTRVRIFSESANPFDVDARGIHIEMAARYVNRDCSFDLRVLVVSGGNVVDAYFFPWNCISNENAPWSKGLDANGFRCDIPEDIDLSHLVPAPT